MNILFWCEKYLPFIGGVEVLAAELIGHLRGLGHTFTVVTCSSDKRLPDEEILDGVPVYRFPFHGPLYEMDLPAVVQLCERVKALKRAVNPDIVHVNTTQPSIFYQIKTKDAVHSPTVVTIHSPPTYVTGPKSLYGQLVCTADQITAVSHATGRQLAAVVPEVADRILTIHNALPMPDLEPSPLPYHPTNLLCIGRLVEEKGFDVALEAFAQVRRDRPNARMTVAGDGAARPDLVVLARRLGLDDDVSFTGWIAREDVADLMNRATAVVVPSRWQEPFGLVALQGSQMARPVIATRVGGLPEVVEDGVTGLVVEPEDPSALREAMLAIIDNPHLAASLGKAGRNRAVSDFSVEECASAYDQVYRRFR